MTSYDEDLARGFILAAPSSNAGKTTVTLALLRAFQRLGIGIAPAKTGPDYIDPQFHELAAGRPSINLDAWAMRHDTLARLIHDQALNSDLLLVEGVMGLFDGAAGGAGSTATLAARTGLPVVLVLDVKGQAQSAAAVALGFRTFRPDVRIAGVLLNRVGSDRHLTLLREAFSEIDLPVLGALRQIPHLHLPSRHLGLVQAMEHTALDSLIDRAADHLLKDLDVEGLRSVAEPLPKTGATSLSYLPPLGQRVAIARDLAFAFSYPHLLSAWQAAGATLSFFSPLADEAPDPEADAIFLPGGYPELHAGVLSQASRFREAMLAAAARNVLIYGECGGYMTLGQGLVDQDGTRHAMLGLMPLVTSFQARKLHLGYRRFRMFDNPLPWSGWLRGHEFHYASILEEGGQEIKALPLFEAFDAEGASKGVMGLRVGSVMGSFAHLIDRE